MKRIVLSVCAAVAAAVSAWGDIYTWTGGTGAWDDATHWQVNGETATQAPGEGDDVLLPAPKDTAGNYTVTATGAVSVRHFTIGAEDDSHLGTVTFVSQTKDTHQVAGDFAAKKNAVLTHFNNTNKQLYVLDMSIGGNMTLERDAKIDVVGCGFTSNNGPGGSGSAWNRSPSYGGLGHSEQGGAYPNRCYGSVRQPTDLGSGGSVSGDAGGGAVKLVVSGTLTVNGDIIARNTLAPNQTTGTTSTCGTGGSVWLTVGTLAGSGTISVAASPANRAGGGGRLSVVQRTAADLSQFADGTLDASMGTCYLENRGDVAGRGELIFNGNRASGASRCELSKNVTDAREPFGKVTVLGTGVLQALDDVIIRVADCCTAGGSGISSTSGGGLEIMAADGTASVSGTIAVDKLICTNAGAVVDFAAGTTITVNERGLLSLRGEAGNLLTLQSDDSWTINAKADYMCDVAYVAAKNSDADGGNPISDFEGRDLGGNANWTFPRVTPVGCRIYWTGGDPKSSNWASDFNWIDELGQIRAPKAIDAVVITNGCVKYPEITVSAEVHSLTVGEGASLTLANAVTLSVSNGVSLAAGTLVMNEGSSFRLVNGEAQTADCGGNEFCQLVVECPSVTFQGGFRANGFSCEQGGRDVSLAFSAADVYQASTFRVIAGDGGHVSLASTEQGQQWYLKALPGALFSGVEVRDCDASVGAEIHTVTYVDSGNNVNWFAGASVWTGASDGTWGNTANWNGCVPTATNDVIVVPSSHDPVIAAATVVRSLTVGDGLSKATLTVNQQLVVSNDVFIAPGSELTHGKNTNKRVNVLDLTVGGDMVVPAGATINVNGCGFSSGGPAPASGWDSAASHGGLGSEKPPACYGSIRAPVDLGSAGTDAGGGAVKVVVGSTLTLDGSIEAKNGGSTSTSGNGSGGSIWLTVGALEGAGSMSVTSVGKQRPGGGGRIAIVQTAATELSFPLENIESDNGTLYLENASDAPRRGELVLKGPYTREIFGTQAASAVGVPDGMKPFGKVTVVDGGTLSVKDGTLVSVCGDVDAANGRVLMTNGGLDLLAVSGTVRVAGAVEVSRLVCTNAGASVEIAEGSLLTVCGGGSLMLQGGKVDEAVTPLTLWGTGSWTLAVNAGVDALVEYVAVSNSIASVNAITDTAGTDLGGNDNWKFPIETGDGCRIYWTGGDSNSTDWGSAKNWIDEFGQQRAPKTIDAIVITNGFARYPTLSKSTEVYSLAVGAGASLRIVNSTLTVVHDVSFAADALTMDATSTFALAGTEAQMVDCGGNEFCQLVVECPSVTFQGGFRARRFSCEQGGRDVMLRFSAGDTYEAFLFRVVAGDGRVVYLDSTEQDSPWYLRARPGAQFLGTSVSDCDASVGAEIHTVTYTDRGNNVNWFAGASVWTGASDGTWGNAANWNGCVPTATNDVIVVPSSHDPVIAAATVVRSLTVGDGLTKATLTVNQPLVVSNDVFIAPGSELTHGKNTNKRVSVLDLTVGGDMVVPAGAIVNVNGCGFSSGGPAPASGWDGAASHGGLGSAKPPACYGSIRAPVDLGSAGTDAGGGAVKIVVGSTMTLDGDILAKNGGSTSTSGNGSGGSIWLTVGALAGSGTMSVRSKGVQRPGGGGRIAIVQTAATELSFPLENIESDNGTLYLENASDAPRRGELVLKGTYVRELFKTQSAKAVGTPDGEEPFGKVTIADGGSLMVKDGVVVPVCGDVDAANGTVAAAEGTRGGLDLCATGGVQHVAGTLDLGALVVTNGAEEIEFAAGQTIAVADNGVLWLEGGERRKLRLRSSVPGTQWQIAAGANLTGKVCNLDVCDSDAGGGQTIKAKRSVGRSKRANNRNWEFPAGFALIVK